MLLICQQHYQVTSTHVYALIESTRCFNRIINSHVHVHVLIKSVRLNPLNIIINLQVHVHFNIVCHTGCCGYIHDVTIILCAPSIKMYTRIY